MRARFPRFDRWCREVRDPAERRAETVCDAQFGRVRLELRVAHVPAGWTWSALVWMGNGGCAAPWAEPTAERAHAVGAMVKYLRLHVRHHDLSRVDPRDVKRAIAAIEALA